MDIGSINSTSGIQNLNNLNNNSNIALNKAQLKYSIDDFKNNSWCGISTRLRRITETARDGRLDGRA